MTYSKKAVTCDCPQEVSQQVFKELAVLGK